LEAEDPLPQQVFGPSVKELVLTFETLAPAKDAKAISFHSFVPQRLAQYENVEVRRFQYLRRLVALAPRDSPLRSLAKLRVPKNIHKAF
jgi:hypothetical protein